MTRTALPTLVVSLAAALCSEPRLASAADADPASAPASAPAPATAPAPAPAPAAAPAPVPRLRLFAEGDFIFTANRIGALLNLYLRLRLRLYESGSTAFSDNYVGVGLVSQNSPVFTHTGAYVEIAPASMFRLTAAYQFVAYYGILNSLLPLTECSNDLDRADPRCDFDVDLAPRLPGTTAAFGHRAFLAARARAKVGPIVVANTFNLERWWFPEGWAPGPDAFWYNELHYLPQSRADTDVLNNGSVLYEVLPDRGGARPHVLVGVDDRVAYSFGTRYLMHRVGVIGILRLPEWGALRDVAAVAVFHWYTHDRYKAGPVPFMGLVVAAATPSLL